MAADPAAAPAIEVHGDVQGSIVYGDHNFVVNTNHGTIVYQAAQPQVRRRAEIPPPPRPPLLLLDRAAELAQIAAALAEHAPAALHGPEGAGKSTLLRQAAASAPAAAYPDGVVLLNGPGATGVPQGMDDLAQSAFNALFESEPTLKVTAAEARTHLGSVQTLFVLDELNLPPEMLDQVPDLFATGGLLWAAPHPPRGETARTVAVGGLPRAEAIALLLQISGMEAAPEDQAALDEMCELAQDLPLALVTLGRWAKQWKGTPVKTLRILKGQAARRETNGVRKAVAGSVVWLGSAARRLFGLAASTNGPAVDRDLLAGAAGLTETEEAKGLGQLADLGLLQPQSPALAMHPFFKEFARERYRPSTERRNKLHESIVTAAQARPADWAYLRAEMGNLLGALENGLETGRPELAGAVARLLAPLLVLRGRWDLWHYVFHRLGTQTADRALRAWGLHELGTRALALGDPTGAARLLREALDIRQSLGDETGAAYTRHNLNWLAGPPPPEAKQPPRPPTGGRSWLVTLAAAGLGGLGLLGVVGAVLAALYCAIFSCRVGPPIAPSATAALVVETAQPSPTALQTTPAPTVPRTPTATRARPATFTGAPTETDTRIPSPTFTRTRTHTPTPTTPPVTVSLMPVADAYVSTLAANNNFGGELVLRVGVAPQGEFPFTTRSFLRFNLSAIPKTALVSEARLGLWLVSDFGEPGLDNDITVYEVQEQWEELKITWNSAQSSFINSYDVVAVSRLPGYYEWDVTKLAQRWVAGAAANWGLALVGQAEAGDDFNLREFASRESAEQDPAFIPVLYVTYLITQ